ncbi:MAG TPA: Asp-tRNA(Asn)/Glu-tRNA(Gln) amidotransferase subunit GatC [Tissierellaceae bacterium]|nr:Asp-tRNA(Asn)/Glu-tRNA(Gln) amidotransferase subunit GatC [Tissierellaceae bacterium]
MISKETVSQIADLCKLDFNDVESDEFVQEFQRILNLIEKIKEVDTEGVEPTYQINEHKEAWIEDQVKESLSQKEVLGNTVEEKYGFFKILKVLE